MMRFATARGNVRIAYDVLGTGAPLMLLHDFGQSSAVWHELGWVEACVARGRQVVLVDLRGHGDSSEPEDVTAYAPILCAWDMIAVLDHAGIRRADVLGYGVGGRIALCMAASAADRVHAVAAGGAHPFAEWAGLGNAVPGHLEAWARLIQRQIARHGSPASDDRITLSAAVTSDWPDIADAVAQSGVPLLLFVGKEDPRCSLVLSFAERASAHIITLTEHDYATTVIATDLLLPRVLDFFEEPERGDPARLPPCLGLGSWA
jgi:pimeloyl-ACP methyl ester carboxylesterase